MFYILNKAPDGRDKREAVFRGIYLTGDESLTSLDWIEKNVRSSSPLGALYPGNTHTAPVGVTAAKPCHAMRKEFGSYVATSFSLFHAQKLLGHSSPNVTSDYYAGLTALPELNPIGISTPRPGTAPANPNPAGPAAANA